MRKLPRLNCMQISEIETIYKVGDFFLVFNCYVNICHLIEQFAIEQIQYPSFIGYTYSFREMILLMYEKGLPCYLRVRN